MQRQVTNELANSHFTNVHIIFRQFLFKRFPFFLIEALNNLEHAFKVTKTILIYIYWIMDSFNNQNNNINNNSSVFTISFMHPEAM